MPVAKCSESDFIYLFETLGAAQLAKRLGVGERAIHKRRRDVEARIKRSIKSPTIDQNNNFAEVNDHPGRLAEEIKNGQVLLGTDSHYIPGITTDAHRAFVRLCREIKPALVIKNGDELDFSSLSRFTPIGWEKRPNVVNEIEWASERLQEIRDASKNSKFYWPLGNHDARFETRLATVAQEYKGIQGVHLKDHFPGWRPCWALWINDDTVIKHRFKGGLTAARQNTMLSGKHIFTGHTHRMQVYYFRDYNGLRYGMECGTMADPDGPQFIDYTEDAPKEWTQGFALLTFSGGKLLPPEPIICPGDGTCLYRGKVYEL